MSSSAGFGGLHDDEEVSLQVGEVTDLSCLFLFSYLLLLLLLGIGLLFEGIQIVVVVALKIVEDVCVIRAWSP